MQQLNEIQIFIEIVALVSFLRTFSFKKIVVGLKKCFIFVKLTFSYGDFMKTLLYKATRNLLLVGVLTMTVGCGTENNNSGIVRTVKTAKVTVSKATQTALVSGIVCAGEEHSASFRVAGNIDQILVRPGQTVTKGDLIATLDTRDFENTLMAAESKYKQVKSEVERVTELYKRESVTKNDYEKAISGEKTTESLFNAAKNRLQDTQLKAPITGIVQSVDMGVNSYVLPGMSIITIVDISHLEVETNISATLFLEQKNFSKFIGLSELFTNPIPLKLLYIAPKANSNQLYKMRLNIDDKDILKQLAIGMLLNVKILYEQNKNDEISVPITAIFNENGESFVWVITDDQTHIERRKVTIEGMTEEGKVRITEGLNGTETIVSAGVNLLRDDDEIRILQPSDTNVGNLL